jgi:putative ABC transport system permease protein
LRIALRLAVAGLITSPGRTLVRIVVLASAVALLGSMLLFVGHSLHTMTGSAVRSVPLDWQGPVGSYRQDLTVASEVAHQRGMAHADATATAPFAAAEHRGSAGRTSAGQGAIFAVDPSYIGHFQTFRLLRGGLAPGGVVLDQQLAATLQAQVGDTVRLTVRPGHPPVALHVSGVSLISAPDVIFQPLNPTVGPAPAQPPANAAIMSLSTFAQRVAPALPSIGNGAAGASAVPGALSGVQWQVQAQVDPGALGGSPSQALARSGQILHRVERTLPGQVQFVDNLSDSLNTAAGDALYAETLYIMLAVPGALVALGLAYLAALGAVDRDRRDLALLRARGGSRRVLVGLAVAESSILGVAAGLLGAGLGLVAVDWIGGLATGVTATHVVTTVVACVALAVVGALGARLGATASVLRASVNEGRRSVRREGPPLWQRLYLDVVALVLSALIYWLTASTGFSAVVNPDSNPTLSLSVYMFFAPALLWLGATLLLVRLRGRAFGWVIHHAVGRRARTARELLLVSAARRSAVINRGLIVVGLLLAFGVNLGVFTATYNAQAKVDAELTLGADVVATAPPGAIAQRGLTTRIAAIAGVRATSAVDHSYAYVGPDLQDTYGIDAGTIGSATTLRDSYFVGASAAQTLQRLSARPDAVLVSKETMTDYQLKLGDLLRLRVLDRATGHFHLVPFHVAGVVQEFPAAPRDSFMVVNLNYLRVADHAGGPNLVFARTSDPAKTAAAVAAATASSGVSVKSIDQQTRQTVSSITTIDLTGISRIEEAFVIALAGAAMALYVALVLSERRHEFATMAAVGESRRSISAFITSEVVIVLAIGLVLAAALGTGLSLMLVAMLQHVFDPPPDHLILPWRFLAELAGAAVLVAVLAVAVSARRLRHLPLGSLLREQ